MWESLRIAYDWVLFCTTCAFSYLTLLLSGMNHARLACAQGQKSRAASVLATLFPKSTLLLAGREAGRVTGRISDPHDQQLHKTRGCQGLHKPITIIYVQLRRENP